MEISLGQLSGFTDENGFTAIDLVQPGAKNFSAKRQGYAPVQKSLLISSDTTFTDTLDAETYKVNITVKNSDSGDAIENCLVFINDDSYYTDSEGKISISDLEYGFYHCYAEFPGFVPLEQIILEIFSDTTINLLIKPKDNTIIFKITDKTSGDPVYRAVVSYSGSIKVTGTDGVCSFAAVPVGTIPYGVSDSQGIYFPLMDSLIDISDTIIEIQMIRAHAIVMFQVFENQDPLFNADIALNESTGTTDINGTALFYNLPAREKYSYTIAKSGYRTVNDSIFLEIDTTVNIQLDLISDISTDKSEDFRVFPNPSGDIIFIESHTTNAALRFIDPNGTVLLQTRLESGTSEIDVSSMPSGLYYLSIWDQNSVCYFKQLIY